MRFVFLGPPGVGKGTQAENVSIQKTFLIFLQAIFWGLLLSRVWRLELKAKDFIDKGLLVPDSLIVSMVVDEISSSQCSSGFILDGFPRNLIQAEILDRTLDEQNKKINNVFYFTASEDVIIERIAGRRICASCDMHYHQLYKASFKRKYLR